VPPGSGNESNRETDGFTTEGSVIPRWRPRPRVRSRSLLDSSVGSPTSPLAVKAEAALITSVYKDDFNREQLGLDWTKTSERWVLNDGRLCGQSQRNHPIWLSRRLPTNARIEFTAESFNPDGDIKVEAWGNGKSFAHGTTYDDATSYLFVFGGWKNTLHVLARLNEHGDDRLELRLDKSPGDRKQAPVEPGKRYRFMIERNDGQSVAWYVDGEQLFSFEDPEPLTGGSHEYFAFNGWETKVCFDDLVVTPLAE
jgi:hypothetical protein